MSSNTRSPDSLTGSLHWYPDKGQAYQRDGRLCIAEASMLHYIREGRGQRFIALKKDQGDTPYYPESGQPYRFRKHDGTLSRMVIAQSLSPIYKALVEKDKVEFFPVSNHEFSDCPAEADENEEWECDHTAKLAAQAAQIPPPVVRKGRVYSTRRTDTAPEQPAHY